LAPGAAPATPWASPPHRPGGETWLDLREPEPWQDRPSAHATPGQPKYWISVGYYAIDGSVDTPFPDGDSDEALSFDVGLYNWTTNEMGLGLELGYQKSTYEVGSSSLATEDVDATRYLFGVRLADTQSTERWLYWARAGGMYREDEGDLTGSDDGFGFYAGLGVEFRPTPKFGVGPEVLYSQAESFSANEWQLGLKLTPHL
jgi:opacity protein-like surface antigen